MLNRLVNLLGQQDDYAIYPCRLCLWDSRAKDKHWTQKHGETLKVGGINIINEPLVPREIIFPTLHIKIGLINQCIKA